MILLDTCVLFWLEQEPARIIPRYPNLKTLW